MGGRAMKLGYVILYVPDVAASVAFYEAAFGVACRFIHEGQYAELETGATALAFANETFTPTNDIFRRNRPAEQACGAEIAFVADDVTAQYARAVKAGAQPAIEPTRKPWGQIVSYVRDNNGFLVEICSAVEA
jgi:lactoylglutathione lyase